MKERRRLHYGWVVVIVGLLTVGSCLGIGRFAFGMLLPSMSADLPLTAGQSGVVSTGNFLGYLVGALLASTVSSRIGARWAMGSALTLVALCLASVALSTGFWAALAAFSLAGVGSGLGNVTAVGVVSAWFLRSVRGKAAGYVVSGSGYGIMLTGLLVPQLNERYGADGWRYGWAVLAAVVAVVAVTAFVLVRDHPSLVGAEPVGHAQETHAHAAVSVTPAEARRATWHLGAIYALFGASYVIYVTFIVTTLVTERGVGLWAAGWFWFAIGLLSIFCGVFGTLSDRIGRKGALVIVFLMHATAFSFVGLGLPDGFVYASVVFFGLAAWSIPGIMGAAVGDYLGPAQAMRALGRLTVFFGAGQAVAPTVAGWLAARTGSFDSSYLLAAGLALAGALLALTLRPPPRHS